MRTPIPAIYDNGAFRPTGPVDLPDNSPVVVIPSTPADAPPPPQ